MRNVQETDGYSKGANTCFCKAVCVQRKWMHSARLHMFTVVARLRSCYPADVTGRIALCHK